jgi:hypothetical protein
MKRSVNSAFPAKGLDCEGIARTLGQALIHGKAHVDFASYGYVLWRRGTLRHAFQKDNRMI